jgi:hypothetical protein
MAELRNRSPRERFESWVNTARATPRGEAGGPIGGMWNDLVSSIPTPSDIGGLLGMAATVANPSPSKYADLAMAGQSLPQVPGALLESISNHPFATAASFVGPGAGIGAYRELMPLPARAFLHQFYGGGRPMTSIPKRLHGPIERKAAITGVPGSGYESKFVDESKKALLGDMKASGVKTPKRLEEDWHYVDPDLDVPIHLLDEAERGVYNERVARPAQGEMSLGLGKFFYNSPEDRIFDYYKFHPSVYERHPDWQELENAFSRGGMIEAAGPIARQVKAGVKNFMDPEMSSGNLMDFIGHPSELGILARWLSHRFGTPYPIDIQLPRR